MESRTDEERESLFPSKDSTVQYSTSSLRSASNRNGLVVQVQFRDSRDVNRHKQPKGGRMKKKVTCVLSICCSVIEEGEGWTNLIPTDYDAGRIPIEEEDSAVDMGRTK